MTSLIAAVLIPKPAAAAPAPPPPPAESDTPSRPLPPPVPAIVAPEKRDELLGSGWQQSTDLAWTMAGDSDGFHVLAADEASGYSWHTVATLSEAGFDTDQWIGNACLTGSGRRLVVVYAPRSFSNEETLSERGGFTAIVDLATGAVTKLRVQTSLSYFNPGCGTDESAVLTQESGADSITKSRLIRLAADTAKLENPVDVSGQLTSAVPVRGGIVGADNHGLVMVHGNGSRALIAAASSTPFHVLPDAEGGVVFMDQTGPASTAVRRVASTTPATAGNPVTTLATGELAKLTVTRGARGTVNLTGKPDTVGGLPSSVRRLNVPARAEISTLGRLAITSVQRAGQPDPRAPVTDPARARPVQIDATAMATRSPVSFTVDPAAKHAPNASSGRLASPALAGSATVGATTAGSSSDPVEAERWCSVPRNDPRNQVLQPKPRQVEWAVDQAVRGVLTVQRPANWMNLGMPAYQPQQLFPRPGLSGSGGFIPAQIMLGIATTESNLWQASNHVLPGEVGNPLVGNFYGRPVYDRVPGNDWDIRWDKADCGYGVMQITDRMRLAGHEKPGEQAFPYQTQRAVALDFAANIALGVRMLETKWNELAAVGMTINDSDPQYIENWFFAVWAYNSGFHPFNPNEETSPWGVGWLNNPINPRYPRDRPPFLEYSYDDARTPQYWPYEEKVIGWAGHPINAVESPGVTVGGYRWAWWNDVSYRVQAKPYVSWFCDASNECDPDHTYPNDLGEPAGPCTRRDLQCWYHRPVTYKANCPVQCGHELLRFDPGYPYQGDGISYPPACTLAGLPDGALIVDDVPDSAPPIRPGCGHPYTNSGSFRLDFANDSNGLYPSKVDFHQAGGGFGGHFWFAHTHRPADEGGKLRVTGTWSFNQAVSGWGRVLVHLPDHGAQTQQAKYDINLGNGTTMTRYLNQGRAANVWMSLGVYPFSGSAAPSVTLSNVTQDGRGIIDVAWDAIAIQRLPSRPRNIVAALGDSYSSGEGMGGYLVETDANHGTKDWNACRRSGFAWPRRLVLPGSATSIGALSDAFSPDAELTFVACSGAKTWNVRGNLVPSVWADPDHNNPVDGQFGEINQIDSGAVNQFTNLVVLTIGGNDGDAFTDAVEECAIGLFGDCGGPEFQAKYHGIIDQTQVGIAETIRKIHERAPIARIVLIGYPELMRSAQACQGFTEDDATALHELAEYMSLAEAQTVRQMNDNEAVGATYLPSIGSFNGHRLCDSAPWLNGVIAGPKGDGDFHAGDPQVPFCFWTWVSDACLSRESFHPNSTAGGGWAAVISPALPG